MTNKVEIDRIPDEGKLLVDGSIVDLLEVKRTETRAEEIARKVLENHEIKPNWRRTGQQIEKLIIEAVEIALKEEK